MCLETDERNTLSKWIDSERQRRIEKLVCFAWCASCFVCAVGAIRSCDKSGKDIVSCIVSLSTWKSISALQLISSSKTMELMKKTLPNIGFTFRCIDWSRNPKWLNALTSAIACIHNKWTRQTINFARNLYPDILVCCDHTRLNQPVHTADNYYYWFILTKCYLWLNVSVWDITESNNLRQNVLGTMPRLKFDSPDIDCEIYWQFDFTEWRRRDPWPTFHQVLRI